MGSALGLTGQQNGREALLWSLLALPKSAIQTRPAIYQTVSEDVFSETELPVLSILGNPYVGLCIKPSPTRHIGSAPFR